MNARILSDIAEIKKKYDSEGFVILGIFGSFAREDETEGSDLDILYEFREPFYTRYPGWAAYGRLEEIRQELQRSFGRKIDLASRNALDEVGVKHILPEVIYV